MALKRENSRLSMRHRDSIELARGSKQLRPAAMDKENVDPGWLDSTSSTIDETDYSEDIFYDIIADKEIKGLLRYDKCR